MRQTGKSLVASYKALWFRMVRLNTLWWSSAFSIEKTITPCLRRSCTNTGCPLKWSLSGMQWSLIFQRQLTFWGRSIARSVVISTTWSSLRLWMQSEQCWSVLMCVMQAPSLLLASLPQSTLKCHSTTVTTSSKGKAKRWSRAKCVILSKKQFKLSQGRTRVSSPRRSSFTETVWVMPREAKYSKVKFHS